MKSALLLRRMLQIANALKNLFIDLNCVNKYERKRLAKD